MSGATVIVLSKYRQDIRGNNTSDLSMNVLIHPAEVNSVKSLSNTGTFIRGWTHHVYDY